jgi:hypothetical protein
MSEKVNIYYSEIQNIINNGSAIHLYKDINTSELNWYGPVYSGVGHTLEDCCEIFYKKIYYSIEETLLKYKFKLEIIVSKYSTKIKYIYHLPIKYTYDKIISNKMFHKSSHELLSFNNRLLKLENINNKIPKYILNNIDRKYKFLCTNTQIFNDILYTILCNKKKNNLFPNELIQNIIIYLFNLYY